MSIYHSYPVVSQITRNIKFIGITSLAICMIGGALSAPNNSFFFWMGTHLLIMGSLFLLMALENRINKQYRAKRSVLSDLIYDKDYWTVQDREEFRYNLITASTNKLWQHELVTPTLRWLDQFDTRHREGFNSFSIRFLVLIHKVDAAEASLPALKQDYLQMAMEAAQMVARDEQWHELGEI